MTTQALTITIRHNSDHLVDNWSAHPETDREASVAAYNKSLESYLSMLYGSAQVIDEPGIQRTQIEIEPCPDDPRELEAQIQLDMEEHWERGDFWVEA